MRKRIVSILMSCVVAVAFSVPCFAFESEEEQYEINTINEFETEATTLAEKGDCSKAEAMKLFAETEPEIVAEFVEDKMEEADKALAESEFDICENIDEFGRCKVELELDDGCVARFEFETGSEADLLSSVGNFFIPVCNATYNGEKKWQTYGNHYFTAKKSVWYGAVGLGKLILENHYKLDKYGITERYGDSAVSGVGIGAHIDARSPKITDAKARTKGESDVNMYCVYDYEYNAGIISAQGNFSINSRIIYLDKDATNKKIKVQFEW